MKTKVDYEKVKSEALEHGLGIGLGLTLWTLSCYVIVGVIKVGKWLAE